MAIKEPVLFCNVYPTFASGTLVLIPGLDVEVDGIIRLPYGLAPINYDTSCEGIHISVGNLNATMTAVIPFLRLADCVLKLIKFAQAVPDALGPPPNPGKIASAVFELGECLQLMISFTLPAAFLDFCKLIRDIIRFILLVLWCIRQSLTIKIQSDEEAVLLSNSTDVRLQEMGACLAVQNQALGAEIDAKMNGASLLLGTINILIGVTGIGGAVQTSPNGELSPAVIDDFIATVKASLGVFLGLCP